MERLTEQQIISKTLDEIREAVGTGEMYDASPAELIEWLLDRGWNPPENEAS